MQCFTNFSCAISQNNIFFRVTNPSYGTNTYTVQPSHSQQQQTSYISTPHQQVQQTQPAYVTYGHVRAFKLLLCGSIEYFYLNADLQNFFLFKINPVILRQQET